MRELMIVGLMLIGCCECERETEYTQGQDVQELQALEAWDKCVRESDYTDASLHECDREHGQVSDY